MKTSRVGKSAVIAAAVIWGISQTGWAAGADETSLQKKGRPGTGKLAWIQLSKEKDRFVYAESKDEFVVWGVNYDHDENGRLLEDYWEEEWGTVTEDLREIKELGANVVRIHLQLPKFMEDPGSPNEGALKRLRQLVDLAEETGLYLDLTGLGCYHKADMPDWYDALSEADRWETQAQFWEAIARTCRDEPAVFCYDLMNEPILAGGNKAESEWLTGELGGKHFVQRITLDLKGRTRKEVAKAWVDKLTGAIRKHDTRHLITVGVIPWAHTWPNAKPLFYSPEVSENLDFASVHFYPEKGGVEKAITALAVYDIGKPLVIEEMFPLKCGIDVMDRFIDASKEYAEGWISFYWGKTSEEYANNNGSIASAIKKSWLDYFRDKAAEITGE